MKEPLAQAFEIICQMFKQIVVNITKKRLATTSISEGSLPIRVT